jgi:hypothetical protein
MALTLVAAVLAYWPQASHYIHKRYAQVRPYPHLTTSFRWARSISGARIGLAGTTAAFFQYPYYGNDISNAVQFVARQGPHGSFIPYANCPAWRAAVNRGHFNYLVTSRAKSRVTPHAHRHPPEEAWASSDPATRAIIHQGPMAVFRVRGKLDPNACAGAGAGALKHTA